MKHEIATAFFKRSPFRCRATFARHAPVIRSVPIISWAAEAFPVPLMRVAIAHANVSEPPLSLMVIQAPVRKFLPSQVQHLPTPDALFAGPKPPRFPAWAQSAANIASAWGFVPCLRVSVTGRCNARCAFGCHNEGNARDTQGLRVEEYRTLARCAAQLGLSSVKLTGGEPCTRSDLPAIVRAFQQAGFADISLISNGSLLNPQLQRELKSAGLHRLTVSLHSLNPALYQRSMRLSPDDFAATMRNLEAAGSNFQGNVKLNAVFVPGMNFPGEVIPLVRYACEIEATLSVLSIVHPGRPSLSLSQSVRQLVEQNFEVVHIQTSHKRLVDVQTLILKDGGAVELDDFRLEQAVAVKNTNPYCAVCPVRQICTEGPYAFRLTANGRFKPCLIRRDNELPASPQYAPAISDQPN